MKQALRPAVERPTFQAPAACWAAPLLVLPQECEIARLLVDDTELCRIKRDCHIRAFRVCAIAEHRWQGLVDQNDFGNLLAIRLQMGVNERITRPPHLA